MSRTSLPRLPVGAALLALGASLPGSGAAQEPIERVSAECETGSSALLAGLCRDAALALHTLHGGVGLLMTAGGALPASPSTAGHRLPGSPRVVVDAGATWSDVSHPELTGAPSEAGAGEKSFLVGARATAVVGIFNGFSPVAGVGGVFAVDAVGTLRWVRVPNSPAGPGSALGWGGGLRVGILRESFALPGLTLSAVHERAGALRYGTDEGPGAWVEVAPEVTSLRAVLGKDLWPAGLSAGVGWDLYRGAGRIEARLGPGAAGGGPEVSSTERRDLSLERRYLFAGINYTWVVTQIAADLSWAPEAVPAPRLRGTESFRPGGRALQGAFTVRLIY